jgi:hypothetical protein
MSPPLRPLLALCASFAIGAALGAAANFLPARHSNTAATSPFTRRPDEATLQSGGAPSRVPQAVFPNASELTGFDKLPLEKQLEALKRIAAGRVKNESYSPGIELWIARMARELSADQAAALLEAWPLGKEDDEFMRATIAARLAAQDPMRALELGKKLDDQRTVACAIAALAHTNGADALRAMAEIEASKRGKVWENLAREGGFKTGGSFQEMALVLREKPELLKEMRGGWAMSRILGMALTQSALNDPAAALASARQLGAEIERLAPADNSEGGRDGRRGSGNRGGPRPASMVSQMIQSTLSEMRATDPDAASRFFDALGEKEKSPWMHSDEAITRFQRQGIDAAVSFAEKQNDDESMRSAALGTWWVLAQRDRSAAVGWIDSLPEGAFRQGVLTAVMIDAWNQSSTWGSTQAAVEAGATLGSEATKIDYFASLLSDRAFGMGRGSSRAELIQFLPINDAQKALLQQRLAPIKAK